MSFLTGLRCIRCNETFSVGWRFKGCPLCSELGINVNLSPTYDLKGLKKEIHQNNLWNGSKSIWRFKNLLPISDFKNIVSLGEGGTPLIRSKYIGDTLDIDKLWFKNESINPTWSYKDRLASVVVSKAKEMSAKGIILSSTGNQGAAIAAYAHRAGLPAIVLTPASIPITMQTLVQKYGGMAVALNNIFDRWRIIQSCVENSGWFLGGNCSNPPIGGNPYGIEGYKTIAYELCEDFGWKPPDVVIVPVAFAEGFYGIWKGFDELFRLGLISYKPKMVAAEVSGSLTDAQRKNVEVPSVGGNPNTVAFSIGIAQSTYHGLRVIKESQGVAVTLSDEDILSAKDALANEGIFAEISSAAPVAALQCLVKTGWLKHGQVVVCIITASGLKDVEVLNNNMAAIPLIEPSVDHLFDTLKSYYEFTLT